MSNNYNTRKLNKFIKQNCLLNWNCKSKILRGIIYVPSLPIYSQINSSYPFPHPHTALLTKIQAGGWVRRFNLLSGFTDSRWNLTQFDINIHSRIRLQTSLSDSVQGNRQWFMTGHRVSITLNTSHHGCAVFSLYPPDHHFIKVFTLHVVCHAFIEATVSKGTLNNCFLSPPTPPPTPVFFMSNMQKSEWMKLLRQ